MDLKVTILRMYLKKAKVESMELTNIYRVSHFYDIVYFLEIVIHILN